MGGRFDGYLRWFAYIGRRNKFSSTFSREQFRFPVIKIDFVLFRPPISEELNEIQSVAFGSSSQWINRLLKEGNARVNSRMNRIIYCRENLN